MNQQTPAYIPQACLHAVHIELLLENGCLDFGYRTIIQAIKLVELGITFKGACLLSPVVGDKRVGVMRENVT